MADRDHVFQNLCLEAAIACGPDFDAVERFISDRIAAMDEADRRVIERDLERVLAFRAPHRTDRPQ